MAPSCAPAAARRPAAASYARPSRRPAPRAARSAGRRPARGRARCGARFAAGGAGMTARASSAPRQRTGENAHAVQARAGGDHALGGHQARGSASARRCALKAAGTRPDPAVSVPRARSAMPRATATADPELDPPEIALGVTALRTAPYGDRVPTRPVANWSRLVVAEHEAPRPAAAARPRGRRRSGRRRRRGSPAVVGMPATSILPLTASVRPARGRRGHRRRGVGRCRAPRPRRRRGGGA